jgi:hypothetical protein
MYNYIKRIQDYSLYVSKENEVSILDIPIQTLFNKLLKQELTNLYSRERSTKMALKFKSKTPIYINKENLFMCIKSYRLENSLYLNYFSISSFEYIDNSVIINFHNDHSMKLPKKYAFQNQIKKCLMILDFLN